MAFKFLGPLREPGHDAQADAFEAAPPQLGQAARAHIGLAREREHERSTIGPFAPAVAVAIDITEHVEQRTRLPRVVFAQAKRRPGRTRRVKLRSLDTVGSASAVSGLRQNGRARKSIASSGSKIARAMSLE